MTSPTEEEQQPLISTQSTPLVKRTCGFIEITMFLFALYMGIFISLDIQYLRYRFIKQLNNGTTPPTNQGNISSNHSTVMGEVNRLASMWIIYESVAALIPSCLTLMVLPSYSDTAGRKYALVTPIVGFSIYASCQVCVAYFELPLYLLVIASFVKGCFGDAPTLFSGLYAYLSDSTSHSNRSFRMILLDICLGIGVIIAQISIGYVITLLGYVYSYLCLLLVLALNFAYTAFLLEETVCMQRKVSLFSTYHIKKSCQIFLSRSFRGDASSGRRVKLIICLAICSILWMSIFCKDNILTLYLMDRPFYMSAVVVGYFGALSQFIPTLSNIVLSKFFYKRCGDIGLLLIGTFSTLAFCLALAFFRTKISIFFAPLFGFGFMIAIPMARSICSKLVLPEDEGAMFSVLSLSMSLSLLAGMSSTNYIYAETVSFWPPFIFVYMAGFSGVNCILAIVLLLHHRKLVYTSINQ